MTKYFLIVFFLFLFIVFVSALCVVFVDNNNVNEKITVIGMGGALFSVVIYISYLIFI